MANQKKAGRSDEAKFFHLRHRVIYLGSSVDLSIDLKFKNECYLLNCAYQKKKLLEAGSSGVTTHKFSYLEFISPANITLFIT